MMIYLSINSAMIINTTYSSAFHPCHFSAILVSMNLLETMKCAIFDMDGTLLDSMGMWAELGKDLIRSHGKIPAENVWYELKVLNAVETARYLIKNYGFEGSVESVVEEIDDAAYRHYSTDLYLKPGAEALLRRLQELHIPAILATATDKRLVRACLSRLKIEHYFAFVNSCEDFHTSKSSPLIFQKKCGDGRRSCFKCSGI